ncbi:molybdenum cofactor guanylyltransferase MobA [Pseudoroseicyclus sp. CXY001]|uniref:molybdenum cofactor guanylyltransferase MobA n=1 Tax=Pseudoroseicyclus sp. CXY001 TaxID=3242492 RepID=UPI0035710D10
MGLILAGGSARRMGGADKALIPLAGRPLWRHVEARLSPQVADLALSANGDPLRFKGFSGEVLADGAPDQGPLAGIAAGLAWAAAAGGSHLITVPVDLPFLPGDLVPQLFLAGEETGAAIAASGGRRHGTCGLWPVTALPALEAALAAGTRKVMVFAETLSPGIATWPADPVDPFFNVNTLEDLAAAEARLA